MRIGVFLPNWVGDVVMATPALRSLRHHVGAQAHLVGILRPYVADILTGASWFDTHIEYDRRTLRGVCRLISQLRRERLDTILLLTNSFSTALFARLSGAPRRIGFGLHGRRALLTDALDEPRDGRVRRPRSAVDHYLDVVGVLGCPADSPRPSLATTPEEERAADGIWRQFGWTAGDPVILLNTGGAYGSAKTWPSARAAELARRLAYQQFPVLVLCGPAEREAARAICRLARHPRVVSLAEERLSLGVSKACIRRGRLLVTTDSGPRHLAAAFGVPTVTLFGPTDPRWSDNYHPAAMHLQRDLPCIACGQRVCPLAHQRCLRELSADLVLAAIRQLLQQTDARRWGQAG
jgi:heptosyltransferase-2